MCVCGHPEVLHELTATKRRNACAVGVGPKGNRCGCTKFTAADSTDLSGEVAS